jgi:TonB family protein
MNAIQYLIQVNFYLILFYGFYRILLRNETFHGNNRLFLVGGAVLSLLIPVWQFDWVQRLFLTEQVSEAVVYYMAPMQVVAIRPQAKPITWADICFWVYVTGGVVFSIRFILNILNLRKLLMGGVMAFRAFTFGRKIYIDQNLPESQTILKHETVHAQQLHSFDVVFFEILLIINWFNPVLYAYRQSIKNIHEFLADEVAAHEFGKANYARLLLSQEFGVSPSVFTTQFFDQSSLKQRIIMLAKPKSKKTALLKYGLSMPLFIAMLVVSSAFVAKSDLVEKVIDLSEKPANLVAKESLSGRKIVYLLDGKEISEEELERKKPNIKSMAVLKDGEMVVSYGKRAKDGLILLSTIGIESQKESIKTAESSSSFSIDNGEYIPIGKIIKLANLDLMNLKTDETKIDDSEPVDIKIDFKGSFEGSFKDFDLPKLSDSFKDFNMIDSVKKTAKTTIFGKEGEPQPLFIIIDGIKVREVSDAKMANIQPENIKTMSVLKGEEAIKKYGNKGKNGVIEITMKLSFEKAKKQNELEEIVVVGLDKESRAELGQDEEVFETVEEMAEFPGGVREMYKFLGANIKYPADAQNAKTQGKVFLEFVIKKDGTISNIKILKGIGSGCDEEAIRVVKAMPKWKPAMQNGKIVNSSFTLPISFLLE